MPSFLDEYLEHIAFERLLIGRVVPVVPRDAGSSSGTYDLKTGRTHFAIMVHETAGMTLDQAVLKLGIVPLAMGAAWKALDLLMEYALDADGIAPNRGKRWTIEEKVDHARQNRGSVPVLSGDATLWSRLLGAYTGLAEVRHSLVHRRASLDESGVLIGTDRQGKTLPEMTQAEQFAFCRAVACMLGALDRRSLVGRDRNEVLFQLDQLGRWHGLPTTGAYERTYPTPQLEVTLDPPYELPLSALRSKFLARFGGPELNLVVRFGGDERSFIIELESAPDQDLQLDPAAPPVADWCRLLT